MTPPVRRTSGRLAERPFWVGDPLAEFDDLCSRMGTLLQSTFGAAPAVAGVAWSPPADFSETDDAYLIEVDVPGVKRDGIDIELSGRDPIISGEIRNASRLARCAVPCDGRDVSNTGRHCQVRSTPKASMQRSVRGY